jgi:hypothetical protein
MFIEKVGEELLGRTFRGSVGGTPDLFPLPLETNPIGQIALIDGRHWLLLASVLDDHRLARNRIFASKMNLLDSTVPLFER